MKKISILPAIVLLCLLLQNVAAQYSVDLDFKHKQHLLFESIPCDLRVRNETSRLLLVNDPRGGGTVKVRIWDVRGNLIGKTDTPLFNERLLVPPNEIGRIPLDLVQSFRIREPGNYYAIVDLSKDDKRYVSSKIYFEVTSGVEMRKLTSFNPPRKFSLRLINRGEGDELLLRVQSADETLCYGVYPLGFTMKSYPAQMMMDGRDVVHVLHRASPTDFLHFQFTTAGIPIEHKLLESRIPKGPDLIKTKSGALVVEGAISEDLAEESGAFGGADLADTPDLADLPDLDEWPEGTADSETDEEASSDDETAPAVPVPDYLAPAGR